MENIKSKRERMEKSIERLALTTSILKENLSFLMKVTMFKIFM